MTDIDFPTALPRGHVLADYRLESVLGQGGFGITYLATDTVLNRAVALKEFLPTDLAIRGDTGSVTPRSRRLSEEYHWGLKRFLDEARTLARFRHRNIVPVLRFFEANGTGYMTMEHEAGRSLAELIAGPGRLPPERVRAVLEGLLDGLETVHAAGFLHRDIKPANVIVRTDGSPVLIDFGAARQSLNRSDATLTSIVTPRYAPIEQYQADGEQGPWTDIYALAAVVHHAIAGSPPPEATARVRNDPYKPLAPAHADRFPTGFLDAIDAALGVFPETRPRSVAAWRATLDLSPTVATRMAAVVDPESAPTRVVRDVAAARLLADGYRLAATRHDERPAPVPPVTRRQMFSWRSLATALGAIAAIAVGVQFWSWSARRDGTQVAARPDLAATKPATSPPTQSPPVAPTRPIAPAAPPMPPRSDPTPLPKALAGNDDADRLAKVLPPATGPAPVDRAAAGRSSVADRARALDVARQIAARATEAAARAEKARDAALERAGEARIRAAEAGKADLAGARRVEFADGSSYTGLATGDRREGLGVVEMASGERQAGDWKGDRLDGLATLRAPDGRGYEGEWRAGSPAGLGLLLLGSGERHAGNIGEGRAAGPGVRTLPDGGILSGDWRGEALEGAGVSLRPDGERYEGEFQAGRRHGTGTQTMPDRTTYSGGFVDGHREGPGVETRPDGTVRAGLWRDDALIRPQE